MGGAGVYIINLQGKSKYQGYIYWEGRIGGQDLTDVGDRYGKSMLMESEAEEKTEMLELLRGDLTLRFNGALAEKDVRISAIDNEGGINEAVDIDFTIAGNELRCSLTPQCKSVIYVIHCKNVAGDRSPAGTD